MPTYLWDVFNLPEKAFDHNSGVLTVAGWRALHSTFGFLEQEGSEKAAKDLLEGYARCELCCATNEKNGRALANKDSWNKHVGGDYHKECLKRAAARKAASAAAHEGGSAAYVMPPFTGSPSSKTTS